METSCVKHRTSCDLTCSSRPKKKSSLLFPRFFVERYAPPPVFPLPPRLVALFSLGVLMLYSSDSGIEPEMSDALDSLARLLRLGGGTSSVSSHHHIRTHLRPFERDDAQSRAERHRTQHVAALGLDRQAAVDSVLLEDLSFPPRVVDAGRVVRDHEPGQAGCCRARGGTKCCSRRAARYLSYVMFPPGYEGVVVHLSAFEVVCLGVKRHVIKKQEFRKQDLENNRSRM
ncbi:uncharacterized protein CTRU02_206113 [Colletotrichum truncatum]|uniref:Uncharacterized protein n=1 Tax=Colletotrichum truncatum TaxID=5467 RepID=A0ACC3Z5X3_COLTU|nr:uncharacterized protein CTRU02_10472 [Colletotrichum truncatum]KAF6787209.1 hypothetical protein CTRU02_10472 [Colletotrichum truncatum]